MALLKDLTVYGASRFIGDAFGTYIYATLFNTSSGDMGNTAFSRVYVSNDSFIRWKSKTDFIAEIRDSGGLDSIYVKKIGDTMTGALTINPGNTSPALKITSTGSHVIDALNANLSANNEYLFMIGKASSSKNAGIIRYVHNTDGGNNNRLSFGLYSQNDILNILGSGNVGINTTTPTEKLDVNGYVYATGYKKSTSSNSYVLLGGGGHALISSLSVANANKIKTIFTENAGNHYLTFVDSNNKPYPNYENLYTNEGIFFNPRTCSFGHGIGLVALGEYSHAEGHYTTASGYASHASGYYTQATHDYEAAFGCYNQSNSNTLFSIGYGTDNNNKNIFECLKDNKIYIYNVGGYYGDSISGNDIATHVNTREFSNNEWNKIFGLENEFVNKYICCLYIDDFDDDIKADIMDDLGLTFQQYINNVCSENYNNVNYSTYHYALYGTNFFMPTTNIINYMGNEYLVYMYHQYDMNGHYFMDPYDFYGLLPMSETYQHLYNNSLEYDINNEYSPFTSVICGNTNYDNPGEDYILIKAIAIDHINNPIDTNHPNTFNYLYLDSYNDYSIYAQMLNDGYNNFTDFIDAVKNDNTSVEKFYKSGDTLQFGGQIYDIWIKDDGWGGLLPQNITYQELYQHSIECNSNNIYESYCPFVAIYDSNSDTIINYDENTSQYSALICVV